LHNELKNDIEIISKSPYISFVFEWIVLFIFLAINLSAEEAIKPATPAHSGLSNQEQTKDLVVYLI
jgi:hypothetical protein